MIAEYKLSRLTPTIKKFFLELKKRTYKDIGELEQFFEEKIECEENDVGEMECYFKYTREEIQKAQMEIPLEEFITLLNEVKAYSIQAKVKESKLIGIYIAPRYKLSADPDFEDTTVLIALPLEYANKKICYDGIELDKRKNRIRIISEFWECSHVDAEGIVKINEVFDHTEPEGSATIVAFYKPQFFIIKIS